LDSVRLQVGVPELWRNWWFTPGWGDTLVERLRVAQLTASVWGAGLLLAGLPVLLLRRDARLRPLRWVVPASLLGWFVVQYGDIGPAGAFAHHGPYGTFLLGYALLAVGV